MILIQAMKTQVSPNGIKTTYLPPLHDADTPILGPTPKEKILCKIMNMFLFYFIYK